MGRHREMCSGVNIHSEVEKRCSTEGKKAEKVEADTGGIAMLP